MLRLAIARDMSSLASHYLAETEASLCGLIEFLFHGGSPGSRENPILRRAIRCVGRRNAGDQENQSGGGKNHFVKRRSWTRTARQRRDSVSCDSRLDLRFPNARDSESARSIITDIAH